MKRFVKVGKASLLAATLACVGTDKAQAAVIALPDALGLTGSYDNVNTLGVTISGEESVYIVSTMTITNPSDTLLFGNLWIETTTYDGGAQRMGYGLIPNNDDWGTVGSGNTNAGVPVALDTPTTLVLKVNQTTGDYTLFVNPDLNAPEPLTGQINANGANALNDFDRVLFRGGRYGAIPVNTNVTDYTNAAVYTGSDTPFVPEPSSLALLGLGGLSALRRRRA